MKIVELFESANDAVGYHYSDIELQPGAVINSKPFISSPSYTLVRKIYEDVAKELGVYFPPEYGYAYPHPRFGKHGSLRNCFVVKAPAAKVTIGDFDFSLPVTQSRIPSFKDRSLPLEERLRDRDRKIKEAAVKYFTKTPPIDRIELISDVWVVQHKYEAT